MKLKYQCQMVLRWSVKEEKRKENKHAWRRCIHSWSRTLRKIRARRKLHIDERLFHRFARNLVAMSMHFPPHPGTKIGGKSDTRPARYFPISEIFAEMLRAIYFYFQRNKHRLHSLSAPASRFRGWSLATDCFLLIASMWSRPRSRAIIGARILEMNGGPFHRFTERACFYSRYYLMHPFLGVSPEDLMKNLIPNLTWNVEELLAKAQKWKRDFFL
jgi:hypothetical protein